MKNDSIKKDKRILKAFNNLGYTGLEVNTKSNFDLLFADSKNTLATAIQQIDEWTEVREKAKELIDILEEIENEYEKEILRELNPNRTIY